jgi:hypothetical protein
MMLMSSRRIPLKGKFCKKKHLDRSVIHRRINKQANSSKKKKTQNHMLNLSIEILVSFFFCACYTHI